jgi:hypothetical protein
MLGPILTEGFSDQLHPKLKAHCSVKNMGFKILLVLGNTPGHIPVTETLSKHKTCIFVTQHNTTSPVNGPRSYVFPKHMTT